VHDTRRTRLVLTVLLIAAVALITLDFRDGGSSPLHRVGADVFGPVERAAGDVTNPVAGFFDSVTGNDSGEVAALQQQNDQLRAELSESQLSQSDETQLQNLLQLAGRGGYRIVAASVIAAGGPYADTVTIDAGSKDGIRANETVLNGDGLVGTVTAVSSTTSTVLLTIDASAVVGVRMAGTNQIGEVTGTGKTLSGDDTLQLRLFDANAVLHVGEALVTFGSVGDQPYVPGVPIGTVTAVTGGLGSLTQTATVRPFADFTELGVVGVVVAPPRTNPRDSVLPPSPSPSPSATATARPKHKKS
jgi:rod shape-determining protein MreC